MSKSYRHIPIVGITTSESEKKDKRFANRRFRRRFKIGKDVENIKEVSSVWSFAKDGKQYLKKPTEKLMRK